MAYFVKEIFLTLQGEGIHSGKTAVFCRFSGCNLWTGREEHRSSAVCKFCDTDFVGTDGTGGGRFGTADALADAVAREWIGTSDRPFVVLTGGEPMLQVDDALIDAFHERGVFIALETNGTLAVPRSIDWICVSPKADSVVVQRSGDELKLVFPQGEVHPRDVEAWDFDHFMLQPMDGPSVAEHTRAAIDYCLLHPKWRLSSQTHKALGIR